jgi:hypothetical protein
MILLENGQHGLQLNVILQNFTKNCETMAIPPRSNKCKDHSVQEYSAVLRLSQILAERVKQTGFLTYGGGHENNLHT